MSQGEASSKEFATSKLRRLAESTSMREGNDVPTTRNNEELIDQLRLQHCELELQNEELRHSQQELEEVRARYVDLYFHAPVGYITLDHEGEIRDLNFLAAELLGCNRPLLLNTSLFNHISAASKPVLAGHLEELQQDAAGVHHCHLTIPINESLSVHLRVHSITVESTPDEPRQIRTAICDATKEIQALRERDSLQEQLRESQRMEALGRMTSGIAHDFNNLLTMIIGYSKLLIKQIPDEDPFALHANQINKAGQHASELIEQLLSFSRNQSIRSNPLNVNSVITEMVSMFDRLLGDDVELHLHLDENLGVVHFDTSQLNQVLMNLIVNAREAMPYGGDLIIRSRNLALPTSPAADLPAGPYVTIEVEDSGRGIPEELHSKIFDPHFTTKTNGSTHGFGLSTTHEILQQHQATIKVKSSYQQGSLFTMYLPRIDLDELELPIDRPRPCILLVDDHPELRDYVALVLDDLDVDLLCATSAKEALQLARTQGAPIDLVVTDVIMPGMTGPQLIDRIQEIYPDVLALFISGHDRVTLSIERGIKPDAYFLEKPFCPDALRTRVNMLLQKIPRIPTASSPRLDESNES